MKFFQHYLDNELALSKMRKALAKYHNIDLPEFRIAAYRQAGIPTETIIELDREALRLEKLRRATFAKRIKRAGKAAEAASFFLMVAGFYAVWCVLPGDAQAAVLTPQGEDAAVSLMWALGLIGAAGLIVMVLRMADRASDRKAASRDEALGDTSGWRGE